jgi:hypothetical protein
MVTLYFQRCFTSLHKTYGGEQKPDASYRLPFERIGHVRILMRMVLDPITQANILYFHRERGLPGWAPGFRVYIDCRRVYSRHNLLTRLYLY